MSKVRYNVPVKGKDQEGNDRTYGQIAVGDTDSNTAKKANGDIVEVRDINGNIVAGTIVHR